MNSAIIPSIAVPSLQLRLMAACCARPVSDRTADDVARLVDQVEDWPAFVKEVRKHQLQGLVQAQLTGLPGVPDAVHARWSNLARHREKVNTLQATLTCHLHSYLGENQVPNLVLKGLSLSERIHGSLTIRPSSDIDLLVGPEQTWDAVQLLAKRGFVSTQTGQPINKSQTARIMRHYKEVSLSNDAGLMIDLHWRLVGNSHLLKGINPFENSRSIPLGDTGDIRVLGEADEFAYLCSHGAMSDWARLKWLADINFLIADWSDERLMHNFQHAQSINAGRCVLQALALRSVFWGHPIPDALEHELEKVFSNDLIMHPLQCMTAPHKSASLGNTIARMRQQVRSRAMLYGSKAKALAEWRIYVRSLPDILAIPLPAALDWLYAPLHPLTWTLRKLRKG